MGLFQSYTQPGVYTSVSIEDGGISLFGDQRIPVLIGEGQETRSFLNVELHRGSSSVADDRRVLENLSEQVTGTTRTFTLKYGPVVNGNGQGVVSNSPTDIQVYADGNPVVVTSLDGAARTFQTQQIFAAGTDLRANYYFKRKDLFVSNENLTDQVPAYATWQSAPGMFTAYKGGAPRPNCGEGDCTPDMVLSLAQPGFKGNNVSLAFVYTPSAPKQDINAVSGIGTDTIVIELASPNGRRTYNDIKNLIEAGIPTLSSSNIVIKSLNAFALDREAVEVDATNFEGGIGQDTDKTFKVMNVPIVDGTNGGVVTMNPKHVTVKVNGVQVPVASVNGQYGIFTLATGVPFGAHLEVSYYTNTYQDTFDDLPYANVSAIDICGFAPDRNDFINGTDFVLDGDRIYWGNAFNIKTGVFTPGYAAFDATHITPTMVDEYMFRRPVQGIVDGRNNIFKLEDVPTNGAGTVTDNVDLIKVFVGDDPLSATQVKVIRLIGATGEVTLQMPPSFGKGVWASYHRNTLMDHSWTLSVVVPGVTGQGTYKVVNENGVAAPVMKFDTNASHVADGAFANTGIVWPFSFSDLRGVAGATPNETITVTFLDDFLSYQFQPPTAAYASVQGLIFVATNPGAAVNGTVKIAFVGSTPGNGVADANAVTVASDAGVTTVTVHITDTNNSTRTLAAVQALFSGTNVVNAGLAGRIRCDTGAADLGALAVDSAPVALTLGADEVTRPYAIRFKVSSDRDTAAMAQDGLGRTGGDPHNMTEGIGYIGQTYLDPSTAVAFTIVDPTIALNEYGYTSRPSPSYRFAPGDTLVFTASNAESFVTSAAPALAIPGLQLVVNNTYNMKIGDTAVVNTYNKAGNEPKVGEFYYLSLTTEKPDSDFDVKLFTNIGDAYALYGAPTPENRLSLALSLFAGNSGSGQIFACKQVKRDVDAELASDNTFMEAIATLASPLPGSDRTCDVVVTTSTSPVVHQYLAKFLDTQASPRNRAEAIGFIGMGITSTPEEARALARSIKSERVILLYPGGAILNVEQDGKTAEFAVDGAFLAAGLAGVYANPANDVATTLLGQKVVGFSRLIRRTETAVMDLMAQDGITILTDVAGAFEVRDYLTTNPTNVITIEPTCTTITDYLRQRTRAVLKQFIGRKNLSNVLNDVAIVMHSLLKSLIEQEIIDAYRGVDVVQDKDDTRVLHVKVAFRPVFSLKWIDVSFRVSTRG